MIYSIIHILSRLIGNLQYIRYYISIFQKVNSVGSALVTSALRQHYEDQSILKVLNMPVELVAKG